MQAKTRALALATWPQHGLLYLVRSTLQISLACILHETYHVLSECASSKSPPKSLVGVMRDRRFYRRISRPNNSRKACNEMIRCLSDYSTAVGGYLVNLVSHRPTCLGIRVGSFRALIQHTEVDMLVTSRRSGSQNVSRKIMLVQQYRTST